MDHPLWLRIRLPFLQNPLPSFSAKSEFIFIYTYIPINSRTLEKSFRRPTETGNLLKGVIVSLPKHAQLPRNAACSPSKSSLCQVQGAGGESTANVHPFN